MNLSVNNKQNKNNIVLEKNKKLERVNQNKITYNVLQLAEGWD